MAPPDEPTDPRDGDGRAAGGGEGHGEGNGGVVQGEVDPDLDRSEVVSLVELAEIREHVDPALVPSDAKEALSADELRDAWPFLDLEERSDGLKLLEQEDAEEVFVGLSARDQAQLLLHWRAGKRRPWIRLLEPDDVADLIQEAPKGERAGLLALLDSATRKEVQALLAYEEDEAGGLMNTRYARLRPSMTADEAIAYLRRQAKSSLETIYYAYVLDPEQKLLGVVSFRDLLTAPPGTRVAEIMETDVVRANDEMDQETLSLLFMEHDLAVIPVVDAQGVMKGIVTVDDIVDVVEEEATEDIQKFGGMEALDRPYLDSGIADMVRKRGVWLTVLLFGQMLTATVIGYFEGEISRAAVLAVFMPLVIASGGNAGSQASTLVIRAMALGELRIRDWFLVVRRELMTGLLLGLVLGTFGVLRVVLWPGADDAYGAEFIRLGLAVGLSLVAVVMFGTLLGSMLPFILRRLGADPASASAPFVATISDVTGLLIYFTFASFLFMRAL